jgi:hypothetical protein
VLQNVPTRDRSIVEQKEGKPVVVPTVTADVNRRRRKLAVASTQETTACVEKTESKEAENHRCDCHKGHWWLSGAAVRTSIKKAPATTVQKPREEAATAVEVFAAATRQ